MPSESRAARVRGPTSILALLIAALIVAVVFVQPGISATPAATFGSKVTSSTTNFIPTLRNVTTHAFVAYQGLGTANDKSDDFFYIHFGAAGDTTVAAGDIRVAKGPSYTGSLTTGTVVRAGDSDVGATITILDCDGGGAAVGDAIFRRGTCLRYLELDGYTTGDGVYFDTGSGCANFGGASGAIAACDVRLTTRTINSTSYSGGSLVASANLDLTEGTGVNAWNGVFPETSTFYTFSNGGIQLLRYNATQQPTSNGRPANDGSVTDTIYLRLGANSTLPTQSNADGSGAFVPMPGDVRLTAFGSLAAGTVVKAGDADTVPTLQALAGTVRLAKIGAAGSTDRLFLTWGTGANIRYGDIALNTVSSAADCGGSTSQTAFTVVTTAATCLGKATDASTTTVSFFYVDRSPTGFGSEDCVYLNRPSSDSMGGSADTLVISVLDVRMTSCEGFSAGSVVASGNADLSFTDTGTALTPKWYDADRGQGSQPLRSLWRAAMTNRTWTSHVQIYIDKDGNGNVSHGDVRVSVNNASYATAGSTASCSPWATRQWDCGRAIYQAPWVKVTGADGSWTSSSENVFVDIDNNSLPTNGDGRAFSFNPNSCCTVAVNATNTLVAASADSLSAYSTFGSGDSLYLGQNTVANAKIPQRNDVRITTYSSNTAGTRVDATSSDKDYTPWISKFSTVPKYGRFDKGTTGSMHDDAFYAIQGTTSLTAGDARLTGVFSHAAGTRFANGDSDNTATLSVLTTNITNWIYFVNHDSSKPGTYDPTDYLYIDTDKDGALSANDLRLTAATSGGTTYNAGTLVAAPDLDRVNLNTQKNASASGPGGQRYFHMKFLDHDNDGTYDSNEDMVLSADHAAQMSRILQVGDLYMSGTGGGTPTTTATGGGATTTTTATTATTTTTSGTTSTSPTDTTNTTAPTNSTSPTPTRNKPTPGVEAVVLLGAVGVLLAVVSRRRRQD
jgi:hypothetical protein